MRKNQAGQFVDFQLILRADGNDAVGLSPSVRVNKDGAGWANGAGQTKEGENGAYEYAPTQAETNAAHVAFKMTATGAITQLINVYPSETVTVNDVPIFGRQFKVVNHAGQEKYETITNEQQP